MPPIAWTIPVTFALLAGLAVGWLDISATDVQGPLLLLMLAAFAIALISRAPAWMLALAVTLGLPLAHVIAGAGDTQWGMLIALVPTLIASYSGKGVATLIGTSSAALASEAGGSSEYWHRRPASPAWLLGTALLACALVGSIPVYATNVARGQPFAWWLTIIWQVVSFVAWVLSVPLVLRLWRRLRAVDAHGVVPIEIAAHVTIVAGIALLHAIALPLLTRVLLIPLGPGGIARAATWALAAYLPLDALTYCIAILLGHASDARALARSAAARESAVRGELATTRLATLRAQLRPHFLFNALNAAIVLARRGDSVSAARVLNRLAELLRYVLRGADDDDAGDADSMVRLGAELDFASAFLAIEQERFPDRLHVKTEVTPDARDALIPHLLLQPLVENAVHHGVGAKVGMGIVTIRAWRIEQTLHVAVENDGHAFTEVEEADSARGGRGIGLANTRARLRTLYGDKADLMLVAREGGGARAHIRMPYRA